jgi:NagD protein
LFFIDVQGTLIDDVNKKPIDGSIEFIETLKHRAIPYVIVTNNSKQSSEDFLSYLNSIGFDIPKESYLDPIMLLKKHLKHKEILAFGSDEFLNILRDDGFIVDSKNPKSVIIAIKIDYNNLDFAKMIEAILNGAELIGMHQNPIYAKNGRRYPGIGAILEMLKFATGVNYRVVGKPSIEFYTVAYNMIGALNFNDITIISDDIKGDILGAKELGMRGIFVLSGKYRTKEEILPHLQKQPDMVLASIKEAISLI